MELIKSTRRRTIFSEIVYIILNLALPIVILTLIVAFNGTVTVAIVLIFLSKWRVLAVRPRFWLMNLKTNLIDIIVGISYVMLLAATKNSLATQIALTVLYAGWLLYLKPQSKRYFMAIQAGIGQFIGLTALLLFSYQIDIVTVTVLAGLIGYSAARHALTAYDEEHLETIATVWALIIAEFVWLSYHWTLSYPLASSGLAIPQISALVSVVSFGIYHLYDNAKLAAPIQRRAQLTVGVCAILILIILVFARWSVTI